MKRQTGCERVLELLSDGKPHSHMELYRLGLIAHSRVADLRARGYDIECAKTGGEYLYTLRLGQMSLDVAA